METYVRKKRQLLYLLIFILIASFVSQGISEISNSEKVARTDISDVYVPVKDKRQEIIILAVILSAIAIAGGCLVWKQKNLRLYKQKAAAAEEWRTTFDSITDSISIMDRDNKIKRVNKAFADVFGLHPKEIIGRTCYELVHGTKAPHPDCPYKKSVLTKRVAKSEFFEASLNKYLEVSVSPVLDDKGEVISVVHITRDIAERKKNQEEILWKTAILEAQLNTTIDGILIVDNKGKKILQNQRCVELWKIPADIVANSDDNQQVEFVKNSTKDPVKFVEKVVYLYAHPDEISQDEVELKDGTILDRYSAPVIGKNGINFGRIWLFRDITVHKQAEEKLNNALKQAEIANEAKGLFLANMSHEIRTPMNAIMGFCQILSDEKLTNEQADYINIIHDSSKHLLQVINDILDFSKIEAGKMDIKLVECNLKHLFSTVESMMKPVAAEKGLDFRVRLVGSLPLNIRTDPARLQQCLINLVNNAVKFTDKGYVYINVSLDDINNQTYIRFDVEDTGIGISAEKQKKLFKSFSQIDESHSRRHGGTGLGLAITKQLAELLNGKVTVSSEEGMGSTFSLMIPAGLDVTKQPVLDRDDSANKIDIREEKRHQPEFSGHVLVADDVKTNQLLVKSMLNRLGLEVTIAADGNEAVEKAIAEEFDLIFMDIQMPNMDGYEATKILRKDGIKTPIIALTANAIKGDDLKCIDAGCDDYLSKPLDNWKLLEKILKFLHPKK